MSIFVYIRGEYDKLHKNCTTGNVFEREIIMTEGKRDRTINKSINSYRSWYLRISGHSFPNKEFIVPWQISNDKNETEHPEKNNLSKK